jgi:hypothetical protein
VGDGGGASAVAERDALRLEIARLDNATVHLESSNTELRAALTEDPSDIDFREAIGVRSDWHGQAPIMYAKLPCQRTQKPSAPVTC